MINVVSFSGGRTTAYLVYLMEQKRLKEGIEAKGTLVTFTQLA